MGDHEHYALPEPMPDRGAGDFSSVGRTGANTEVSRNEASNTGPLPFPLHVPPNPPPITVINGDANRVLQTVASSSIDTVICDPPYGISLRGAHWDDSMLPEVALWRECYRVLRPGKRLFAFSAARTYHRLATAIQGAGFEILDTHYWTYTSGVPKSRNTARDLDRLEGVERPILGWRKQRPIFGGGEPKLMPIYSPQPITELAKKYEGWGTALRPAHEPICVARKPDTCRSSDDAVAAEQIDEAVWHRGLASKMSIEELVLFSPMFLCPKPAGKERAEGGGHPTMKPIALMEHLIKLVTRMGDVVLDPFAGSGTTGVAAMRLSRGAVLVEMDPHFYRTILTRLEKHATCPRALSKRRIARKPPRAASQ